MASEGHPRRRRWVRRAVLAVCLLAAGAVGLRTVLPRLIRGWVVDTLGESLNIDLSVADVQLDLRHGRATLTDVRADVDGELLATSRRVEADLDPLALLRGDGGTIALRFHELRGAIRVEEDGRLNLARLAPRASASAETEPAPGSGARIALDMDAPDAVISFSDAVTDPGRPLALELARARVVATQVRVAGHDDGLPLMDVRLLGSVTQDVGPALLAAGFWAGRDEDGEYLELHAALTAFDVRSVRQYVTPRAGQILGGDILHVAGTAVSRGGVIEEGLVEVEVDDSSTSLGLRFGGPLDAPVFDMDSPVLEAFRLSYLRVVDSGSSALSIGKGMGRSLWDRSSGLVSDTAGGIGAAISELSLRRLGQGIWKGVTGLFKGGDGDDRAARIDRWAGYARRQLAFRELFMRRRIAVAKELEPTRVADFQELLASEGWKHDLDALIPEADRAPGDE